MTTPTFTLDELLDLRQLLRYFHAGAVNEMSHDLGVANDLEYDGGEASALAHNRAIESAQVVWRSQELIWKIHSALAQLHGPLPRRGASGLTERGADPGATRPSISDRGNINVSVTRREGREMRYLGIRAAIADVERAQVHQTRHG